MESDFETAAPRGNVICMVFHLSNARITFLVCLKKGTFVRGLSNELSGKNEWFPISPSVPLAGPSPAATVTIVCDGV